MGTHVVPDVTGMPFQVARMLANDREITLANPDPDGPPIAALAWDIQRAGWRAVVVARQDPEPGHRFDAPWSSLRVWLTEYTGPETSESIPAPPSSAPPALRARAVPSAEPELLDLTDGEDRAVTSTGPTSSR